MGVAMTALPNDPMVVHSAAADAMAAAGLGEQAQIMHELNRDQTRAATNGWKQKRTLYRLWFEGDEYDGLVVIMRNKPPTGLVLDVIGMSGSRGNMTPEHAGKLDETFRTVAAALHEWNVLDDNDQPVPATYEGVRSQDFELVQRIMTGWMEAATGVPDPLGGPSTGGLPSAVASLPMEPLSPNPAS